MKVSIVIPTYNCQVYLGQTLQSLQAQSFRDFEVLLVDDCSDDGTRELIRRVCDDDARFQAIFQERNAGPAAARNLGISRARGEYVAFVDSDDYWAEGKLDAQIRVFEASSKVGLCATNGCNVDQDGAVIGPLYEPTRARNGKIGIEAYLLGGLPIVTSSVMVRTEILRRVGGFKEAYRVAEDWELWFRVLQVAELCFLEQELTYYRLHGANASSASKLRNRQSKLDILENEVIADPQLRTQLSRRFWIDYQRKCCSFGKLLCAAGQKEPARGYFGKAVTAPGSVGMALKARVYKLFLSGRL